MLELRKALSTALVVCVNLNIQLNTYFGFQAYKGQIGEKHEI